MDFPHAKDIKQKAIKNGEIGIVLTSIKVAIESAVEEGRTEINWSLQGNEQFYYDQLADFLTERGYYVEWDRALLWMKISWGPR